MSKSFKSGSSSPLSSSSDPKTGCASLDCPKDESLKSKSMLRKEMDEASKDQESLESSLPEV